MGAARPVPAAQPRRPAHARALRAASAGPRPPRRSRSAPRAEAPTARRSATASARCCSDCASAAQELDARDAALAARESVLAAAERGLRHGSRNCRRCRAAGGPGRARAASGRRPNWRGLVKLYESMKPRDAAAIFNELDMPVLLQVLDRMKEAKAAPVLAAMQPDKARQRDGRAGTDAHARRPRHARGSRRLTGGKPSDTSEDAKDADRQVHERPDRGRLQDDAAHHPQSAEADRVHNVEEATDGADALAKLRAGNFGLVISDWNMAPMTGLQLLQEVRADARLKRLPFIMITAESKTENVVAAKQAGVSNYIVKPFNAETLRDKIEKVLAHA